MNILLLRSAYSNIYAYCACWYTIHAIVYRSKIEHYLGKLLPSREISGKCNSGQINAFSGPPYRRWYDVTQLQLPKCSFTIDDRNTYKIR